MQDEYDEMEAALEAMTAELASEAEAEQPEETCVEELGSDTGSNDEDEDDEDEEINFDDFDFEEMDDFGRRQLAELWSRSPDLSKNLARRLTVLIEDTESDFDDEVKE